MVNKNSTLKQKFEGPNGKLAMLKALESAKIVHCDKTASRWLANNGKLKFYRKGQNLITQGDHTSTVYVVLVGTVNVSTNGNFHRTRSSGDHIGEMAAIDLGQPRSATVTAAEDVAATELSAKRFLQFLKKFPEAPILVSRELAHRLRQRDEYFRVVNKKPKVFIISAKESKVIAEGLRKELSSASVIVQVWWSETFRPSNYTLPDLVSALNSCDFAIAIGDPVDKKIARRKSHLAVRDNVLLEYGMAVSALGLKRSYYLYKQKANGAKVASDLHGLTLLPFVKRRRFARAHIADAARQILERINHLGPIQTTKPKNQI